jgi:predicted RNA-binding protein with RPS1 domain
MFKEGQKIQVMVLRLDAATGKISLGHRQVLPDPWKLIRENYTNNQRFTTKIARMVVSGAFVKLPEGAEAFIPLSEMSNRRIRKPDEVVEIDQEVEVQIIDLRPDERRMVLSLRAAGATGDPGRMSVGVPSYDDDNRDKKKLGGKKTGKKGGRGRDDDFDESVSRRGYATGGATIGERLGMLKGWAGRDGDEDELDADAVVEAADAASVEAPEATPAAE